MPCGPPCEPPLYQVHIYTGSEDGLMKQWGVGNGDLIQTITIGARVTGLVPQVSLCEGLVPQSVNGTLMHYCSASGPRP